MGQPEEVEGGGVEPGGVAVAADEDDGEAHGDGVEGGDARLLRPRRRSEPEPAEGVGRVAGEGGNLVGDDAAGVGGVLRGGDVDTGGGRRPLAEVDVRVPQAGDRPATVSLVHGLTGSAA